MNKKIMWTIIAIFLVIIIVATIFYIKDPNKGTNIFTTPETTKGKRTGYTLIENSNISSQTTDNNILVRYKGNLYAKALKQDIEGDLDFDGMIDILVEAIYIPKIDGETNNITYLNSMVVRATINDLVLQKDNKVTLFYRVSEY